MINQISISMFYFKKLCLNLNNSCYICLCETEDFNDLKESRQCVWEFSFLCGLYGFLSCVSECYACLYV